MQPDALDLFKRDGFVVCKRWFEECDLLDFKSAYEQTRAQMPSATPGELYDTLWLSPEFMRLASLRKTQTMVNALLGRGPAAPLYLYNARCLIQPPGDDSHCWGWHQEVFHAVPETQLAQTWAPLIHDATEQNGTIEVLVSSHREGIAKQHWTDEGTGYARVDESVTVKYERLALPMRLGSMLFFDPRLVHRSGKNTSGESRFALVGCHTVPGGSFRAPKPVMHWRGKSPQEWLEETEVASEACQHVYATPGERLPPACTRCGIAKGHNWRYRDINGKEMR